VPTFIVTMKGTAEVVGSVIVEAENELEAFIKAEDKAKRDYVTWTNPKVDLSTVKKERVFSTGS
jgi:hypothetical protein